GGECDHSADIGVAGDAAGAAELFFAVDHDVYDSVGVVRDGDESGDADFFACAAGVCGWWIAAGESGDFAGCVSEGEGGAGDDAFWDCGAAGAGGRADAGG